MCNCNKPTINGDDDRHPLYAPTLEGRDELLIDAPGRCGTPPGCKRAVDCHAYHHRLVKQDHTYYLLTHRGSGEERYELNYGTIGGIPTIIEATPEQQYWLLNLLYSTARMAAKYARQAEAARWAQAAANKRIKTRKWPNSDSVKVRIEPATEDTLCFSL